MKLNFSRSRILVLVLSMLFGFASIAQTHTSNASASRQGRVRTPAGQTLSPKSLHELYVASCKVYQCGAGYATTEAYLRGLMNQQQPMTMNLQQANNLLAQAMQPGQTKVNQQAYIPAAIKMIEQDRKKAAAAPKAGKPQAAKARK